MASSTTPNPLDTSLAAAQGRLVTLVAKIQSAHPNEYRVLARHLEDAVAQGLNPPDPSLYAAFARVNTLVKKVTAEHPSEYRVLASDFCEIVARNWNALKVEETNRWVAQGKVDDFVRMLREMEAERAGDPSQRSALTLWTVLLPKLPGEDEGGLNESWFDRMVRFAYFLDRKKREVDGEREREVERRIGESCVRVLGVWRGGRGGGADDG